MKMPVEQGEQASVFIIARQQSKRERIGRL